jgi:putative nucleotidyltransferase with HDIG domain
MSEKASVILTGLTDIEKMGVRLSTSHLNEHEVPCDAEALMEANISPAPAIVFCGSLTGEMNPSELAQLLRSCYQDAHIYFVSSNRQTFKRDLLVKNGFNDAFLVPFDNGPLKEAVLQRLAAIKATREKSYRSVSLIDITPGTVLSFDIFVFLPMNGKHVRYSGANNALSAERSERLKKHQVQSLHVTTDQMPAFYKFTAEQLKLMDSAGGMSETERKERKQKAVRDLLSQMFASDVASDFSQGQELVKDCNEIIKAYVCTSDGKNSWYEKIMSNTGEANGSYSHTSNVATFAALFSLGLGVGKPDELAMAGLLHDIGKADLPPEIQAKNEEDLTPEELKTYQQHPLLSVNMIKQRRLVVSEKVLRAIAEHHERHTGGGYPNALPGERVCVEAQILAMADQFEKLTALSLGHAKLSPLQAIQKMIDDTVNTPSKAQFDLTLLKRLAALFPAPSSKPKEMSA